MEDGEDTAVAISLAVLRKGTAKFSLLRASRDLRLHQTNKDTEAILLSSTAGSGVVGIAGAEWLPAS